MSKQNTSGIKVAVYGTLKEGRGNHFLLAGAEFLGRAIVRGPFAMVDLSSYPCVVNAPGTVPDDGRVLCEVYRVDEDTLASLDLLEGHPSYFRRSKVETPWKKAWMYFLPEDYLDRGIMDQGVWDPTDEELEFYANAS